MRCTLREGESKNAGEGAGNGERRDENAGMHFPIWYVDDGSGLDRGTRVELNGRKSFLVIHPSARGPARRGEKRPVNCGSAIPAKATVCPARASDPRGVFQSRGGGDGAYNK
ncbi:hypothetical protein PUN28_014300 [Cardiocondyla obscurior]|uniref:Uncharacterized protein n=1 Tax=Cardiocondyla obscurior TaxID=286306 RepID=A0AAW2F328_9HYME